MAAEAAKRASTRVDNYLREDRTKCVPRVQMMTTPEPTFRTTTIGSSSAVNTTSSPPSTLQWADIASNAAGQATGDNIIKYPAPDNALETYRAIGMLMIALLDRGNGLQ